MRARSQSSGRILAEQGAGLAVIPESKRCTGWVRVEERFGVQCGEGERGLAGEAEAGSTSFFAPPGDRSTND
jgi:hypothetical protein